MATIAVDIDGPMYEWQRTYRYMLRVYRNVVLPPIDQFWFSWASPDEYTTEADREWMATEAVNFGLFRHGHVTTDAIVGLTLLKQLDHELYIVTHRPQEAIRDTINWIDHHFGAMDPYPWSNIHLLTEGQPKTTIEADILIDDRSENVLGWWGAGRHAILWDRPYNDHVREYDKGDGRLVPHLLRADSWGAVVEAVKSVTEEA